MRQPQIKFIATTKRLLKVEVECMVSHDNKIFEHKQLEINISVRWRQKINVKELEAYIVKRFGQKFNKALTLGYRYITGYQITIRPVGKIFDLQGSL